MENGKIAMNEELLERVSGGNALTLNDTEEKAAAEGVYEGVEVIGTRPCSCCGSTRYRVFAIMAHYSFAGECVSCGSYRSFDLKCIGGTDWELA